MNLGIHPSDLSMCLLGVLPVHPKSITSQLPPSSYREPLFESRNPTLPPLHIHPPLSVAFSVLRYETPVPLHNIPSNTHILTSDGTIQPHPYPYPHPNLTSQPPHVTTTQSAATDPANLISSGRSGSSSATPTQTCPAKSVRPFSTRAPEQPQSPPMSRLSLIILITGFRREKRMWC